MGTDRVTNSQQAWLKEMADIEREESREAAEWYAQDAKGWPYNVPPREPDMVNSPPHYTQGKYEVIEIAEDWFPTEPHLFQAAQYMGRCQHKGQFVQDLEKTIWYIQRRIDIYKRTGK